MASWVTHFMIADRVLEKVSGLDRHGFCVGNIAPDCNVENEDWTAFTPSREVTHWISGKRKTASDCDRFYNEYIKNRMHIIKTNEEYSFLMGYYAHLIADAELQRYFRDEDRVAAVWRRIKDHSVLSKKSLGMPQNWDSVKLLIERKEWEKDIYSMEADYLEQHPQSAYYTEILKLTSFPDYVDYLPSGAIVRKIGIMGYIPIKQFSTYPYIAISKEEYEHFVDRTIKLTVESLEGKLLDDLSNIHS